MSQVGRLFLVPIMGALLLLGCGDQSSPPITGSLLVHVSVNAAARVVEDTDGFFLALDQGTPQHIAVVDSVLYTSLPIGAHRLDLTDVRPTCTVSPSSPDTVVVRRDTLLRAFFSGSCQ